MSEPTDEQLETAIEKLVESAKAMLQLEDMIVAGYRVFGWSRADESFHFWMGWSSSAIYTSRIAEGSNLIELINDVPKYWKTMKFDFQGRQIVNGTNEVSDKLEGTRDPSGGGTGGLMERWSGDDGSDEDDAPEVEGRDDAGPVGETPLGEDDFDYGP